MLEEIKVVGRVEAKTCKKRVKFLLCFWKIRFVFMLNVGFGRFWLIFACKLIETMLKIDI
jgi:hypothetical protein